MIEFMTYLSMILIGVASGLCLADAVNELSDGDPMGWYSLGAGVVVLVWAILYAILLTVFDS